MNPLYEQDRPGDDRLDLKPREFELLLFFLRHPGRAWTRDQLLDRVWGGILTADGGRLMRGMENLLRNALEHARADVTALAEPCDGGVRFEVRDDGKGLPEVGGEVQLDVLNGRRSRSDSAGLGLVVTRKVAEAHGGTLGARNLDGGGAAVWFTIPCEPNG